MSVNYPIRRFLIEIDMDGRIVLSTGRAEEIIGYSYRELKGKNIIDLVFPDDVDDFRKQLNDVISRKASFENIETRILDKYGKVLYVNVSGVFIKTVDPPLYQLTFADITERVIADFDLKKSRDEAELYLDLITHDIANLNQIGMGYLEIALESKNIDDPER